MSLQSYFQLFTEKLPTQNKALKAVRQNGRKYFLEKGLPSKKLEEWKYSSTSFLKEDLLRPVPSGKNLNAQDLKEIQSLKKSQFTNLVFVNGFWDRTLSDSISELKGIQISDISQLLKNEQDFLKPFKAARSLLKSGARQDVMEAINAGFLGNGVLLRILDNSNLERPLHLIYYGREKKDKGSLFGRTYLSLGKNSRAQVLVSSTNQADESVSNYVTEALVDENAQLEFISVNLDSPTARLFATQRFYVFKQATLNAVSVALGGGFYRNHLDIHCLGEAASVRSYGLTFSDSEQHVDHHTLIDHVVGGCQSEQLFKGILKHKARVVFDGKVLIRKNAQKANSEQLSKNLLLSSDAEADNKPSLEIYADDVKATHGATVGQLNEEEIFYLQSRAIDRDTAKELLSLGFLSDILFKIENLELQKLVQSTLQKRYQGSKQ